MRIRVILEHFGNKQLRARLLVFAKRLKHTNLVKGWWMI